MYIPKKGKIIGIWEQGKMVKKEKIEKYDPDIEI